MSQLPNFMWIPGREDSPEKILNLHQIRLVDQITPTSIRLVFSEQHRVTVNGGVEAGVLALIVKHCVASDGTPLADVLRTELEEPNDLTSVTTLVDAV